jgi:Zn-dependent M28 family amino/carboxypeptidase
LLSGLYLIIAAAVASGDCQKAPAPRFDGQRALRDIETQMKMGPRTVGSPAHAQVVDWMAGELKSAGWTVEIQETPYNGIKIRNVAGKRGTAKPWIILGAHFDSRLWADQDSDRSKRKSPVPGANDAASGVAVLLELARVLPKDMDKRIELVMLDAEDNGEIPGWNWCLGSDIYAASLKGKPDAVVIIDMIGDADLNIYREQFSDQGLTSEIFKTAARLKIRQFIDEPKYAMDDDHIPFIRRGMRAADLIDFDYPYWHTTADTLDKVSAASLQAVGDVLLAWLTDVR